MRKTIARMGSVLAATFLSLAFAASLSNASLAATSTACIKDYTALKKKLDAERARAKKKKLPVEQIKAETESRLQDKARECVDIARSEVDKFLDKTYTTRFSYREFSFGDGCELVGYGADIECWVVPAYRLCVRAYKYSPNRCRKLDGVTAQPCCHLKRRN